MSDLRSAPDSTSRLLAVIAAATGTEDYPARIGMTAAALRDLAAAHIGKRVDLHCLINHATAARFRDSALGMFTEDDIKVIGCLLATTKRHAFL